jgi:hypothetical protein
MSSDVNRDRRNILTAGVGGLALGGLAGSAAAQTLRPGPPPAGRTALAGSTCRSAAAGLSSNPGDIVVADDDGVIAFAPDHAEFVVEAVSRVQRRDVTVRGRIANGERIFEMANFGETVKIHDLAWRPDR